MSAVAERDRTYDVHAPLVLMVALVAAAAAFRADRPLVDVTLAGAALATTWRRRDELRLAPLLALAVALELALVTVHLALGLHGDADPRLVYAPEGHALLHGTYSGSPYPAGAPILFALETLLGGSAHDANGLLMLPFQLVAVAAVWQLRTRWSGWLAACVALWPANVFFWEFRFDLVSAAAVAAGIALARHGRLHGAGWALGAGVAVKWTPGLTAFALAAWLVAQRRRRDAALVCAGAVLPLLLTSLPAYALSPHAAAAPYRAQSARGITGESLPYLPLRALRLARPARHFYGPAVVPSWTNGTAAVLQLLAVAAVVLLTARAADIRVALGRAALAPAAFLLANRIFSPQFFVVVLVCCACGAALLLSHAREVAGLAALLAVSTTANAALYPGLAGAAERTWAPVSALALLPATAGVVWLASRGPA